MALALGLFIAMYVGMLAFTEWRAHIALVAAALFIVLGILPLDQVIGSVEWNVILMIGGTMGTVYFFVESKMPARMADALLERTPNVKWAIIALALFAGFISAFMDNVATVLMIAPVAMAIAEKQKINPVTMLVAISISSNLQGAATLVGDTTSILMGGYAGMDFLDFFWFQGRAGMFWVVEVSAVVSALVLAFMLRKENQPIVASGKTEVTDYFPTAMLLLTVGLLIGASFIPTKPELTNGYICVGIYLVCIVRELVQKHNQEGVAASLKELDFKTLLLLVGIFIVIGGITAAGVIDAIAQLFVDICGSDLFMTYTVIVWFSVAVSAIIDNIPFVATMLPVVAGMAQIMGIEPYILYFGLLSGATLGGNITPIGASANITTLGILEKAGFPVKAKDFMKISVPFTLSAVVTGYVLIWLIWS